MGPLNLKAVYSLAPVMPPLLSETLFRFARLSNINPTHPLTPWSCWLSSTCFLSFWKAFSWLLKQEQNVILLVLSSLRRCSYPPDVLCFSAHPIRRHVSSICPFPGHVHMGHLRLRWFLSGFFIINHLLRDFPNGLVVKTPCSQSRGLSLTHGQGTRSHIPQLRPGMAE